LPKPARKMPSYLSFDEASSAVLSASSVNGSPASHRPLWFVSLKRSPQTPDSVIVPSQSGFAPNGVIGTAATPTFKVARTGRGLLALGSDGRPASRIITAKASRFCITSLKHASEEGAA